MFAYILEVLNEDGPQVDFFAHHPQRNARKRTRSESQKKGKLLLLLAELEAAIDEMAIDDSMPCPLLPGTFLVHVICIHHPLLASRRGLLFPSRRRRRSVPRCLSAP
jgi:hypothetical protein